MNGEKRALRNTTGIVDIIPQDGGTCFCGSDDCLYSNGDPVSIIHLDRTLAGDPGTWNILNALETKLSWCGCKFMATYAIMSMGVMLSATTSICPEIHIIQYNLQ